MHPFCIRISEDESASLKFPLLFIMILFLLSNIFSQVVFSRNFYSVPLHGAWDFLKRLCIILLSPKTVKFQTFHTSVRKTSVVYSLHATANLLKKITHCIFVKLSLKKKGIRTPVLWFWKPLFYQTELFSFRAINLATN